MVDSVGKRRHLFGCHHVDGWMGSRWRFGDYGIRGSAVDLLLFVYTHGVRGLLDLPLRYAVFISLRRDADIQAFSHGERSIIKFTIAQR